MKIKTKKIPDKYKKYFWDCDFNKLNLQTYPEFIIERVLFYGTLQDIQWIYKQVNESLFIKTATSSRRLDNRTKNFWKVIFS
jgi:hypothetical protein